MVSKPFLIYINNEVKNILLRLIKGGLQSLVVACWTTHHYHPCLNFGMGISEDCFIFDFTSLPLEVTGPI